MGTSYDPETYALNKVNSIQQFSPSGKKPREVHFQLWDWASGNVWNVFELYQPEDYDRHFTTHPIDAWVWVDDCVYFVRFRKGISYEQIARLVEQYATGYKVTHVDLSEGNVRR